MRVQGFLTKSGNWWAVEIPLLLVHTQGKTKKEAYAMAKDAIESLVDVAGFKVRVYAFEDDSFIVSSSDDIELMAFCLKQQRSHHGLSIREVARRLGSSSPRAYSRYEEGDAQPSLEKFASLLKAIDADAEPVLTIARKIG